MICLCMLNYLISKLLKNCSLVPSVKLIINVHQKTIRDWKQHPAQQKMSWHALCFISIKRLQDKLLFLVIYDINGRGHFSLWWLSINSSLSLKIVPMFMFTRIFSFHTTKFMSLAGQKWYEPNIYIISYRFDKSLWLNKYPTINPLMHGRFYQNFTMMVWEMLKPNFSFFIEGYSYTAYSIFIYIPFSLSLRYFMICK